MLKLLIILFVVWTIWPILKGCACGGCFKRVQGGCVSKDELHHPIPSSLIDPVDPYFEYDAHRLRHHFTLFTSGCKGCAY